MKIKLAAVLLLTCILLFSSCSEAASFSELSSAMDSVASSLGGKVIIFRADTSPVPSALISLYGRAGDPPDELSLVDHAVIWYSDRLTSADAAVFHAINATDVPSIIKMCRRRAETLKLASGIDMVIESSGHYVCIYTDGIPELAGIMSALLPTANIIK